MLPAKERIESEIEGRARVIERTGEAVQHAFQAAGGPMFADQAQQIVPGILAVVGRTAVNDDRQLGRSRHFHLLEEDALLHVARRVIVKVVEPDLAPGDDFGIVRQALQFVEVGWLGEFGFMRVNSDGRVNPVVLLGELDGAVERAGSRAVAVADGQHAW